MLDKTPYPLVFFPLNAEKKPLAKWGRNAENARSRGSDIPPAPGKTGWNALYLGGAPFFVLDIDKPRDGDYAARVIDWATSARGFGVEPFAKTHTRRGIHLWFRLATRANGALKGDGVTGWKGSKNGIIPEPWFEVDGKSYVDLKVGGGYVQAPGNPYAAKDDSPAGLLRMFGGEGRVFANPQTAYKTWATQFWAAWTAASPVATQVFARVYSPAPLSPTTPRGAGAADAPGADAAVKWVDFGSVPWTRGAEKGARGACPWGKHDSHKVSSARNMRVMDRDTLYCHSCHVTYRRIKKEAFYDNSAPPGYLSAEWLKNTVGELKGLIGIRAPLGTGKTQLIRTLMSTDLQGKTLRFVVPLVALAEDTSRRLNVSNYQNTKGPLERDKSVVVVVNSLTRVAAGDTAGVLVFDELESVMNGLGGSHYKGTRASEVLGAMLEQITATVRAGGAVLALDAHLDTGWQTLLAELPEDVRDGARIAKAAPPRPETWTLLSSPKALLGAMVKEAHKGHPIVLVSDSQKTHEVFHRALNLIVGDLKKIILANGPYTSVNDAGEEINLIEFADKIRYEEWGFIGVSPKASSGVSFEEDLVLSRPGKVFILDYGTGDVRDVMQRSHRFRGVREFCYLAPFHGDGDGDGDGDEVTTAAADLEDKGARLVNSAGGMGIYTATPQSADAARLDRVMARAMEGRVQWGHAAPRAGLLRWLREIGHEVTILKKDDPKTRELTALAGEDGEKLRRQIEKTMKQDRAEMRAQADPGLAPQKQGARMTPAEALALGRVSTLGRFHVEPGGIDGIEVAVHLTEEENPGWGGRFSRAALALLHPGAEVPLVRKVALNANRSVHKAREWAVELPAWRALLQGTAYAWMITGEGAPAVEVWHPSPSEIDELARRLSADGTLGFAEKPSDSATVSAALRRMGLRSALVPSRRFSDGRYSALDVAAVLALGGLGRARAKDL